MRFRIRGEDEEYVDRELTKLIRRLSKAKKETSRLRPDKEAYRIYVTNAMRIIQDKAKGRGLDQQTMKYIMRRAEDILRRSYPEPINLEDLINDLVNEYRSHQKQHHWPYHP